jgi:hypothetical protein
MASEVIVAVMYPEVIVGTMRSQVIVEAVHPNIVMEDATGRDSKPNLEGCGDIPGVSPWCAAP